MIPGEGNIQHVGLRSTSCREDSGAIVGWLLMIASQLDMKKDSVWKIMTKDFGKPEL